MRRLMIPLLLALLAACSGKSDEASPVHAATYAIDLEKTSHVDSSLVDAFNETVYAEVARVRKFSSSVTLPEYFPDLRILTSQFEAGSSRRPSAVCYSTTERRFYLLSEQFFERDFNELISGRFENVDDKQAFAIAALAVMLHFSPKIIVTRPADILLESHLREYINDSFIPDSTNWGTVMSTIWWAWEAFPSANNEYRKFFNAYKDSIESSDFLKDLPEDLVGPPEVSKRGIYWEVQFYGIPSSIEPQIVRYWLRVADDGRLHELSEEPVYYY